MLAFKEWSFIVNALGSGKQNLIIRKGGIHEDEFVVQGKKFLLFPTIFHQAPEMIKPDWLPALDGYAYNKSDNTVKICYMAEIADSKVVEDIEVLNKLSPYHAWKDEVIQERYERGEKMVHLLIVQVHKLKEPITVDMLAEYGGCKSWIDIPVASEPESEPVINPNIR
ncbi:DUF1802 family protein [Cytophagaceae bacterium ABcell3]|nr:DUF1802 family protein [Cytophagaceae bacterium ABcell3]